MYKKKSNYTPFPATQSASEGGIESQYARLAGSLLKLPFMQALPHAAFHLYVYMILYAGNKLDFDFAYGTYKGILSKDGFQKSVKTLVAVGLIDIVEHNKNLRRPNKYRFSARWKEHCQSIGSSKG